MFFKYIGDPTCQPKTNDIFTHSFTKIECAQCQLNVKQCIVFNLIYFGQSTVYNINRKIAKLNCAILKLKISVKKKMDTIANQLQLDRQADRQTDSYCMERLFYIP